jgi:hypothetical protein
VKVIVSGYLAVLRKKITQYNPDGLTARNGGERADISGRYLEDLQLDRALENLARIKGRSGRLDIKKQAVADEPPSMKHGREL